MRSRLPISLGEFRNLLLTCRPPSGWGPSRTITVGFSGGADSTCLLYLLRSWTLQNQKENLRDFPTAVLSIIVDHSLQQGSTNVAEQCRQFCKKLGILSLVLRIPWAENGFPKRPEPGNAFETVARGARHRVLFEAMRSGGANILATGHHGDDNLETVIMRMMATSVEAINVTPMQPIRRWGLSYGIAGMDSWMIKPLLTIPKDRILATCETQKLTYINDLTNFQPLLTQRNFIRHHLQGKNIAGSPEGAPNVTSNKIQEVVDKLELYARSPLNEFDKFSHSHLYHAIHCRMKETEGTDQEVDAFVESFRMSSPVSSFAFSIRHRRHEEVSPAVKRGIVLRILRYVSPKPWGSPLAEVSHSSDKLRSICGKLWSSLPAKFTEGSEVQWDPIMFRVSDKHHAEIRFTQHDHPLPEGSFRGWVAYRQKPIARHGLSKSYMDITSYLNLSHPEQFIWDNRFLITVSPRSFPDDIRQSIISQGKVILRPHGTFSLPRVEWSCKGHDDVLLAGLFPTKSRNDTSLLGKHFGWIQFDYIRTLSAL